MKKQKAITTKEERFLVSFEKIKDRWEDAWTIVGELSKNAKAIVKDINNLNVDAQKNYLILKLTPTLISISKEIRDQLIFIRNQEEQINKKQNNLIINTFQINQYMNDHLKKWEKEGFVKVLKQIN